MFALEIKCGSVFGANPWSGDKKFDPILKIYKQKNKPHPLKGAVECREDSCHTLLAVSPQRPFHPVFSAILQPV